MLRYNILEAYSRLEGIEQVLRGMSQRARFESKMERSIIELKEYYSFFEKEFHKFFPDLQEYVNKEIRIL
jgi:acyl carrier protein phosphodiesterase